MSAVNGHERRNGSEAAAIASRDKRRIDDNGRRLGSAAKHAARAKQAASLIKKSGRYRAFSRDDNFGKEAAIY